MANENDAIVMNDNDERWSRCRAGDKPDVCKPDSDPAAVEHCARHNERRLLAEQLNCGGAVDGQERPDGGRERDCCDSEPDDADEDEPPRRTDDYCDAGCADRQRLRRLRRVNRTLYDLVWDIQHMLRDEQERYEANHCRQQQPRSPRYRRT